ASQQLGDRLAEQQRAVAFARSAAVEVQAPPSLRALVGERRDTAPAPDPPPGGIVGAPRAPTAAPIPPVAVVVVGSHPSHQRFSAALSPTALAPRAHGDAKLTMTSSGWRIELNATGLPRLAGAGFYEAWLRNSAGVLVPIGTFNEPRDVTLWAG